MNNILSLFCMLLLLVSCKDKTNKVVELTQEQSKTISYETIAQLEWFIGEWNGIEKEAETHENWQKANDSTLELNGFTLVNTDTVFWEKVILAQRTKGTYFIVQDQIKKDAAVIFTMQEMDKDKGMVVFENKQHDFPQIIRYWKPVNDTLKARIEGTVEGEFNTVDFFFTR